jgi:hypothetical protein
MYDRVFSELLDQLPIAQATPIAREYNEQLAEAQAKDQVVSTAPRTFRSTTLSHFILVVGSVTV